MRAESTIPFISPAIRNGVLVLGGYGIRASVERRHLVVSDGIGRERRRMRLSRATSGLTRLVILGHTGTISLEALRWLSDVGAGFTQIDADGKVIATWGQASRPDAQLLRRQALATSNGVGVELARDLILKKLRGQGTVIQKLSGTESSILVIDQGIQDLKHAKTFDRIRLIESIAGAAYWSAWKSIPVRFARKDQGRIPDHWLVFGARVSPLTGSPRNAANPANALLNYLYGILEAEARMASLAVGLDPGMGILHADQRFRDSFACDLMEPVRPTVDAFVLDMLHTRTFSAGDFFETRQGVCRVLPPITHFLAETARRWSRAIAPFAEEAARFLLTTRTRRRRHQSLPTPLTQENRSTGREMVRQRPTRWERANTSNMPRACRNCGVILNDRRRWYCNECLSERQAEMVAGWSDAGQKALARLRLMGRDPAHGGYAGYKRGRRNAEHSRAAIGWKREHDGPDNDVDFRREIQPRLQNVPLREIAWVTGFSIGYCSLIRRGLRVPHLRHWEALKKIE